MKSLYLKNYLKKCIVSLCVILFIFSSVSSVSYAESASVDGITYEFNVTDDGLVLYRVTSDKEIIKLELPAFLDGKRIISIMGYRNEDGLFGAFQSLDKLEEVVVPEGVTTIGTNAFRNCAKLEMVGLSTSVETIEVCAFMNCTSLRNIYLPKNVMRVRYNAFAGCTNLEKVCVSSEITFDEGVLDEQLISKY